MSESICLPPQFAALAPFAAVWGPLTTQEQRYAQRQHSTMAELRAFHAAALPHMEAIFAHLDRWKLGELPLPEDLLFRTMLGLTEVIQAVEVYNQPGVPYAPAGHTVHAQWREGRQVV